MDLISIFAYLKPGLLRTEDAERPARVKAAIRPYFLRRLKSEVLPELPAKVCEPVWLELLPQQRVAYDQAERKGVVSLNEKGESVTVYHILALITKLKQLCNHDPLSGESCKLEYLQEQLDMVVEQGNKALVFSQYPTKTLRVLEPALRQFNPLVYHGQLSDRQRAEIVTRFQELKDNKVLLMSVKAGGVGLTLTEANFVYHFDLWWNPAVALQAEDRTHRIGQKKTVFVASLLTRDTIEERIYRILKEKRRLIRDIIDDLSDKTLKRVLTEEELFGLFGLQGTRARGPRRKDVSQGAEIPIEQLSPTQFEELIARLYRRMGYETKLTPKTRDKGVDIYATRTTESGTEFLAIQCKHFPNGTVGVDAARALYGVIQDQPKITRGVLATSGHFSKDCEGFARGKRLELFDGLIIRGLLFKYNCEPF